MKLFIFMVKLSSIPSNPLKVPNGMEVDASKFFSLEAELWEKYKASGFGDEDVAREVVAIYRAAVGGLWGRKPVKEDSFFQSILGEYPIKASNLRDTIADISVFFYCDRGRLVNEVKEELQENYLPRIISEEAK